MKAPRVRLPRISKPRSKILALLALFVAGSALSIVTSLVTPDYANAITNAQKDYCTEHYGEAGTPINTASTIINMPPTTKADWTNNKCSEICTTQTRATTGIIVTVACDRDKVPSEDAAADPNDSATAVLKTEYSAVAEKALCGKDLTCIASLRATVAQCVDTVTADASGSATFPDVDTDALADCVKTNGLGRYSAAQITKLKKAFGDAREDITAKAQDALNAAAKEECDAKESEGYKWNDETNECEATEDATTCGIEGVGWIMCPTMTIIASINDQAYAFLANNFLSVRTELITGSLDAWSKFRDVANILFVVAILIVVYSQLTSAGISNYGIKKLLPKIIIAAILVNISYVLCQIAVDLSNILGYGISAFFDGIKLTDDTAGDTFSPIASGVSWTVTIGAVLVGGGALLALGVSVPVLLAALLAIGLIVLILVARQALIVLLVVIAPLAFVAYLLPNTEQWFRKWLKMFSSLLLLFPIIGVVFGASALAGRILYDAANGAVLMELVALGATALPFFVVPGLLKGALNAVGSIGTKAQGLANKAGKRVGGKVKDTTTLGAMGKQYKRNQSIKQAQVLGGQAGNRFTKRYHGYINRHTGGYGDKISAQGAAIAQKLKTEDVDNEVARMGAASKGPHLELDEATEAYRAALNDGDTVKARAAQKILLSKGNAGVGRIEEVIAGGGAKLNSKNQEAVAYAKSDLAAAGLKGKNAALNQWSYDPKQRSFDEVADDADTYNGLSDAELATQSDGTLRRAITATAKDKDGNVIAGTTGLSKERAERVLDNKDLQGSLNEKKYDVLHTVSGRPRSAPAAGGASPTGSAASSSATSASSAGTGGTSTGAGPAGTSGGAGTGSSSSSTTS